MAARGEIAPVTSGRVDVRCITASISRSITQLRVFAPPADKVPPTTVATTSQKGGIPRVARIITGIVVMSSVSMMRGLVSATF